MLFLLLSYFSYLYYIICCSYSLEYRQFDLIICDNIMPVMNGPEAMKVIRGLGFTGLVIGVTGNTLPEDVKDFLNHGADRVLGKPLRLAALKQLISEYFEVVK